MFVGQNGIRNIPEEIGTNYFQFGVHLLDDPSGQCIRNIQWQYHNSPKIINEEILRRWLEGEGRKPVQWATLIQVLKDISMLTLAEDIECGIKDEEKDNSSSPV